MSETLKQKTARGLLWGALNNGAMQFIGLVFGIVLGRLLNPSDYGMIAMITIFTITATALQDSGFGTAIVNLDKPKDEDYNSVFWFNVLTGLLCYVILFFSAPLIARYYHHPQLVALSRYVFLSIIFSSLGVSQSAYLQKHLMVKQPRQGQCGRCAGVELCGCGDGLERLRLLVAGHPDQCLYLGQCTVLLALLSLAPHFAH